MKNRLGLLLFLLGFFLLLFLLLFNTIITRLLHLHDNAFLILFLILYAISILCTAVGTLLMRKSGINLKIGPEINDYDYNNILFDKFYHDLNNNKLPKIPNPTKKEIMKYTQMKNESLKKAESSSESVDMSKLLENNSIPVEVDIWVDKVYNYYFNSLKHMLGMFRWCDGARKALYQYKGYTWYTASELYPDIIFD